jgi:hypothetical protein
VDAHEAVAGLIVRASGAGSMIPAKPLALSGRRASEKRSREVAMHSDPILQSPLQLKALAGEANGDWRDAPPSIGTCGPVVK